MFYQLKPWLAPFYSALTSPSLVILPVSRQALNEIKDSLSISMHLDRNMRSSSAKFSWKLIRVGARMVSSMAEVQEVMVGGNGRTTVHFLNHEPNKVKCTPALRQAALRWSRRLSQAPRMASMLSPPFIPLSAAADAFADEHRAGIGGWFSFTDPPLLHSVSW